MPRLTISRAITWHAEQHPDEIAVIDDTSTLTWRQFDRRTNRLARAYEALGVGVDSLVTVALPNGTEFIEACVAAWKLGATPQPLSYRLPSAERDAILELARPTLVVGLDLPAKGRFPCLPPHFEPDPGLDDGELSDRAARSWKAPTSSGSTGTPKLIFAAASAHVDPAGRVASFVPARAVQLVSGPLFHSAPFTYAMRGLMTGHRLVILPRFDARRVLDAIDEHRVTWAPLVPTMMSRIWALPDEVKKSVSLDSLESIMHIGSPCPPWLKRAFIDWLGPERVVEVYAGTESAGITTITGSEWLQHPGSVGRPTGGSEMRIVAPDASVPVASVPVATAPRSAAPDASPHAPPDAPSLSHPTHPEPPLQWAPPGVVGEIVMRRTGGPTYHYRGADPLVRDGWHTLGDLGWIDADGYLYLADRASDLINTGGVNVYPAEVEGVLEQHPGIRSAVVFGVPDTDLGEVVVALIDVGQDAASTPTPAPAHADLHAWLIDRIDPEKRPRHLRFVTAPLRDDAGKVRRRALRDAWLRTP